MVTRTQFILFAHQYGFMDKRCFLRNADVYDKSTNNSLILLVSTSSKFLPLLGSEEVLNECLAGTNVLPSVKLWLLTLPLFDQ